MAKSAEREGDWAIAQFDVAGLPHDAICIGNSEIREVAMVFLETVGALHIWFMQHLGAKVGELLVELLDLPLGLEVLESTADGCVGEADGDGA